MNKSNELFAWPQYIGVPANITISDQGIVMCEFPPGTSQAQIKLASMDEDIAAYTKYLRERYLARNMTAYDIQPLEQS